jgi:hypothetical protein
MVGIVVVLVAAVALLGCGGNRNAMAKVEGDVKFDGQPIEKGSITFLPTDGKGATVGAEITAGKFSLLVPPGPKRIEVYWPRIVGKQRMYDTPDSPTVDVVEELIPPVYNIRSTLTQDIAMPKTRVALDLQAVAGSIRQ